MSIDPRLEAIGDRTSKLADLLDALWQAAPSGLLKESTLAVAADYALGTHNALQRLIDEGAAP